MLSDTIKRIMVAVDFSEISIDLVRYALSLARKFEAQILLVNVINQRDLDAYRKVANATSTISLPDLIEKRRQDRWQYLTQILENLDARSTAVECQIRMGVPFQELIRAIEVENIDLVIMGTRGHGHFTGMLFGSTAARMFEKCPVPLLTLRNQD
jgi:nucleotide-binding universal stress UspA family protein